MNLTPRKPPGSSTSHITKSDMEASRLVFVFVKDAKPKRKVAIPVPDGYLWQEFLQQVKSKLRIPGVKDIFLAASGQRVTSLDELQDIDELCVVEGPDEHAAGLAGSSNPALIRTGGASTSGHIPDSMRQQSIGNDRFKVVVADGAVSAHGGGGDDEGKYTRRASKFRRFLQRMLPSVFAPTLPIVNRDVHSAQSADTDRGTEVTRLQKRRKQRRGILSWQNLLPAMAILLCMTTMLWFLLRAAPKIS
ncbi:hypothetical protein DUNSADRAFT_17835 [Dunaliella salina]|uniref:Ubiquitin-like domain-containing protein n=1 Tax=Dunaliella salina TaxID=3046 RepID=A0ABQ7G111_DUNSA|nr:hypothetical protein DUNSADRAFT_17835 [Dunaliella salina]|eukprot:KAF5828300.1 hypothetical protein DUNSADRAFT_17835 [Dunaliella salina]